MSKLSTKKKQQETIIHFPQTKGEFHQTLKKHTANGLREIVINKYKSNNGISIIKLTLIPAATWMSLKRAT